MIGREISHYRIIEELGSGGMGVVYKAEDTKLDRTVALKFLRADALLSEQDRARFKREARAVSSLEHSNICSIYEIDETADGQTFISMPCYDGETLRQKIDKGPLRISDAVDVAAQVAEGLEEAHDKGIVHRDIKSGNIIVTGKGQVKIMDFGLARTDRSTRLTSTGVTLGTVSYMSPEQATGEKVDRRTDVWSLGVILYEMLTGRLPFEAAQEQAVMYLIVNKDPEPITGLRTGVPMELERITGKAMAKRPDERYQTAAEMLADLRAFKRKMESDALTSGAGATSRVSGKPRVRTVLIPLMAVAAVAVGAFLIWAGRSKPLPRSWPFQVTHSDVWQMDPAISPDGEKIAYASNESGNLDIYVIDSGGGNSQSITKEPSEEYAPAWFPDGRSIAFVSNRSGRDDVWKVGQFGGSPTLLIVDATDPDISPDGRRIAFSRPSSGGDLRICVAPLGEPDSVKVLTGDNDGLWEHRDPAWSPDGSHICYSAQHNLWVVPSEGGRVRRLTTEGAVESEPVWSPDGRHVYFSSYREGTRALWRVSSKGGKPERVTMGGSSEACPSVSRNGRKLAYSTHSSEMELVIRDVSSGREKLLPALKGANVNMPTIAPDKSSVVFTSKRWGPASSLWKQQLGTSAESNEPVRLTDHPGNASHPTFSPDGKWIAYYRILGEERDIWIIASSGGQPLRFTDDPAPDIHPAWSPDGSNLAFVSGRGGGSHVWKAPVKDGRCVGPAVQVTQGELIASSPSWSPDGQWIAFVGLLGSESEVWVVSSDASGPPRRVTQGADALKVKWNGAAAGLLVTGTWRRGEFDIRRVSFDGKRTEDLSPPVYLGPWFGPTEAPTGFDVSRDGKLIVYCRLNLKGNVWIYQAETGSY
jgi:Tol biopolymer transport system component/tRNA A-37 threonylcarbamoyl transferase component Bud32